MTAAKEPPEDPPVAEHEAALARVRKVVSELTGVIKVMAMHDPDVERDGILAEVIERANSVKETP